MTRRWLITALGKDRPGIVAGVTKVLYQLGCNLEDSAMTRLEGEFAIMLIFSCPAKLTEARLRGAFMPLERRLGLAVHLKRLRQPETATPKGRGRPHAITVYGRDKPGIVFQISGALAKRRINITDVHTHRSAGGPPWLYLMVLEVEVPSAAAKGLEPWLKQFGKKLGVEVSVRQAETEVL